ncbi:MAG: avidin/streptavidin family protein [Nitrosomonas ureae]
MIDFTGSWKNQHGSRLELKVADGVVTGQFESGVGDGGEVLWVDINGKTVNDIITFNAIYTKYGTIVAWVGQHTESHGTGKIETLWIHATDIDDSEEKESIWSSNRIGSDTFVRTNN